MADELVPDVILPIHSFMNWIMTQSERSFSMTSLSSCRNEVRVGVGAFWFLQIFVLYCHKLTFCSL